MKNKYLIILVVVIVLIVLAGLYFVKDNSNQSLTKSSSNEILSPVNSISHSHGIAVDPKDSNNVYIATHEGLYLLKNDKDLFRIGDAEHDFMSFAVDQNNINTIYSSGHPKSGGNLGFQKSINNGQTWEKISDVDSSPVDFHSLTVSSANSKIIFGYYQGILYRSINEGMDWDKIPLDFLVSELVADPIDENVLYALTPQGHGIMISSDKGASWNVFSDELSGGIVSSFAINPKNNNEMIVYSETLGGIAKSLDRGKTWNIVNEEFNNAEVLSMSHFKGDPNIIYVITHENSIYKSMDNGDSWKLIK